VRIDSLPLFQEGPAVADSKNPASLDGSPTVSALGLRWAALRGMLASPLIEADEQRSLREELLRELQSIEQDFANLPARSAVEVVAKIDVVKTTLRQGSFEGQGWLADLLESVQADLRQTARPAPARPERSPANLQRSFSSRPETPAPEVDQPAVA
jgi:hypothetical protein